jgi:large subunit ribosomal protein L28
MSKICEITGKKVISGNSVSHSRIHTKRTFAPNLQTKKFYIPEEGMWITMKVSAKGMRIINKKGVLNAIKDAAAQGHFQF